MQEKIEISQLLELERLKLENEGKWLQVREIKEVRVGGRTGELKEGKKKGGRGGEGEAIRGKFKSFRGVLCVRLPQGKAMSLQPKKDRQEA